MMICDSCGEAVEKSSAPGYFQHTGRVKCPLGNDGILTEGAVFQVEARGLSALLKSRDDARAEVAMLRKAMDDFADQLPHLGVGDVLREAFGSLAPKITPEFRTAIVAFNRVRWRLDSEAKPVAVGERFYEMRVKSIVEPHAETGDTIVEAVCRCGATAERLAGELQNGKIKHCPSGPHRDEEVERMVKMRLLGAWV